VSNTRALGVAGAVVTCMLMVSVVSAQEPSAVAGAVAAQPGPRPTVAIANIEVTPGGWTVAPPQLGQTIGQLLLDQLVASAGFHVLDGQWLVPEEETGRHASVSRMREAAASRNVDYLILGSVTSFSTERSNRRGGGLLPLRLFFLGGLSRQKLSTTVALTFRIVDVRTGEIVTTTAGQGMGVRKNVNVGGLGSFHGLPLGAIAAATVVNARDSMLDDALRQAVTVAARGLIAAAPKLQTHEHTGGSGGR
jgi:curli biogenesis system outer membrane secretion channel CsgG